MSSSHQLSRWPNCSSVASLVLTPDGKFRIDGNAKLISNPEDRRIFLDLRRQADLIFTSYKTIQAENYQDTPDARVRVVSRVTGKPGPRPINFEEFLVLVSGNETRNFFEFGPELLAATISAGVNFRLQLNVVQAKFRQEDAAHLLLQLGLGSANSIQRNYLGKDLTGFAVNYGGSAR